MSWRNPRVAAVKDPATRQIFQSLENFLRKPTFEQGINLGGDAPTGGDPGAGTPAHAQTTLLDGGDNGVRVQVETITTTDPVTGRDFNLDALPALVVREDVAAVAIPDATMTTVVCTGAAIEVHNLLADGSAGVEMDDLVGSYKPRVAGWYRVHVRGAVSAPGVGEYGYEVGWRWNDTTDYMEVQSTVNALAHVGVGVINYDLEQYFNGTTDEIRVRIRHTRGSSTNFELRRLAIHYMHP